MNKFAGIKPGERVRMTVEFTLSDQPMTVVACKTWFGFTSDELNAATVERVARPYNPSVEGDG